MISKDTLERFTELVDQDPLLSAMEKRGEYIMTMRGVSAFLVSEKIKKIKAQKKMEREREREGAQNR